MGTYRDLGEDVQQDGQHREVDPDALAAEPQPQVLWHRVNPSRGVHRNKGPAEQYQHEHRLQIWYIQLGLSHTQEI